MQPRLPYLEGIAETCSKEAAERGRKQVELQNSLIPRPLPCFQCYMQNRWDSGRCKSAKQMHNFKQDPFIQVLQIYYLLHCSIGFCKILATSMHSNWCVMESGTTRLVAAIFLRESSSLCLTIVEPAMELDSLSQARMNFQKLAKKPYKNSIEPRYNNNYYIAFIRLTKLTGAAKMPTFAIVSMSMHTKTTSWLKLLCNRCYALSKAST